MVVLPVSRLSVPAIPVPLFTEKDISDVSVQRCGCGCTFAVTLTDHASYEMYQLLFDAAGRKLLLQCGGATIGFSLIGVGNDVHRLVFIPEISDEACCSLFCRDKK
jgi:hypothetical protein